VNPSQYPPPAVAPPPRPSSMWVWLGPLLGVLVVFCLFAMYSAVRYCGRASEASGVRGSNDVPPAALDRLERRHVLLPGETIVAYYDATLGGDGTEVAIVTTQRLVYLNSGRTTALPLADIADIRHHEEPLVGDVIEAQGDSGETIRVEIAPLNGGDFFFSSLDAAWKKKRPAAAPAVVTSAPPPASVPAPSPSAASPSRRPR
jgi:hypothetical protein